MHFECHTNSNTVSFCLQASSSEPIDRSALLSQETAEKRYREFETYRTSTDTKLEAILDMLKTLQPNPLFVPSFPTTKPIPHSPPSITPIDTMDVECDIAKVVACDGLEDRTGI